jgi:hypothetical protein
MPASIIFSSAISLLCEGAADYRTPWLFTGGMMQRLLPLEGNAICISSMASLRPPEAVLRIATCGISVELHLVSVYTHLSLFDELDAMVAGCL